MAFERHDAAIQRVSYAEAVKAWVKVRGDGAVNMSLTISGVLASNFTALALEAPWCGVFVGVDEDEGRLQLRFDVKENPGDAPVRKTGNDLRRLTIRAPRNVPQRDLLSETCRMIERGEDYITLELPLAAWSRQLVALAAPSTGGGAAPKPPAPPPVIKSSGREPDPAEHRINAVRYLGKKGVAIEQPSPGVWTIDGLKIAESVVVNLVNQHRREGGMRPITARDLE